MSFNEKAKLELCKTHYGKSCCMAAEMMGVMLYCHTFRPELIRIVTSLAPFAERVSRLTEKAFGVTCELLKNEKTVITAAGRDKLLPIFDKLGYDFIRTPAVHLNGWVVEEDCCRRAFLRGAFLAGGFLYNPLDRYHLELVTPRPPINREMEALLHDMGLPPCSSRKRTNYVLYYKDSGQIEDFLTTAGASGAALALMEAKVEKEVRNRVNRRVNCETANLGKTIDAGQAQLEAIRRLKLDDLPEPLRQAAVLRLSHPDATLTELAALSDPQVSRSGLNHRLKRLMALAEGLSVLNAASML